MFAISFNGPLQATVIKLQLLNCSEITLYSLCLPDYTGVWHNDRYLPVLIRMPADKRYRQAPGNLSDNQQRKQPMENLAPVIRNAARALVVRDNSILLLRKAGYESGERFALPGGGQDPGETLVQTLLRECHEEIGTRVQVGDLVHVADYFKPRDTNPPSTRHLVEFLFSCDVPETYTPVNGHRPDKHQVEVVWAGLDVLADMPLYPRSLAAFLTGAHGTGTRVYLGLID